jgi:NAD-dependent SIR2 family protein deacetylase
MPLSNAQLDKICEYIDNAEGLVIGIGAGMGVDSGMPDFRGDNGFWKAYPGLAAAGMGFVDIACPAAFYRTPRRAWGFYAHRLTMYRRIAPHSGHQVLRALAARMPAGYVVYTSNVDGHMTRAGFAPEQIYEVHGTIHQLQCLEACTSAIWPADDFHPDVDEQKCELISPIPLCPHCGGFARPNILMFGDSTWNSRYANRTGYHIEKWVASANKKVVIEIGAGTAIPSVRMLCAEARSPIIRINPTEWEVRDGVGVQAGAKETLLAIAERLGISVDDPPNSASIAQ